MHDRTDQLPRGPLRGSYLYRFRALARALRHRCARLARPYPLGIIALALILAVQPWGLTAADTKHDLAANPRHFLRGALDAYTDIFTLGQLQNQAYGYLFPHGTFFLAGDVIGLPGWVTQRLWWALILVVGFWGVLRVAEALGIGTTTSRVVGAMAFALSPRVLTTLGAISSETLPMMLAPWVLLPVILALRGDPRIRQLASRSAVAVALMGAVNAVATLTGCLAAIIWWAAHRPNRRWWRFTAWWFGCTLLAILWWAVALLLLGRISPPFLDFIESSGVTTQWLSANLGRAGLKIIESDEDVLLYDIGHIPGAVRIDWTKDLNDPVVRDLIDGEAFAELMRSRGISRDDTVVVYGDRNNWWAAYTAWVFELFGHPDVRLLDDDSAVDAGVYTFTLTDKNGKPAREIKVDLTAAQEIADSVEYGVVKMNVDTDTQYAFTRPVAGHMFENYDGVLKVDGEVGDKKQYDPRVWGAKAEEAMAARVVQACTELNSAGKSIG